MKQLSFILILLFAFSLKGMANEGSHSGAENLRTREEKEIQTCPGEGLSEIGQRKPHQVDPAGELWIRVEPDRSITLFTKDGHDIANYDHIEFQAIWGGYYFFTFRENKKWGMFMYQNKKRWITIQPEYDEVRIRRGYMDENDKYSDYVMECRNNYQTVGQYYMDGYAYKDGMPPVMPNTPDKQAALRKQNKTYSTRIQRIVEKGLSVGAVTMAYDYTEVEFEYHEKYLQQDVFLYSGFTPFAYRIRLDGKEYHQIKVIGDLEKRQTVKPGTRLSFKIRFQPLPANPGPFDIIEGENGGWDVYGVRLMQTE